MPTHFAPLLRGILTYMDHSPHTPEPLKAHTAPNGSLFRDRKSYYSGGREPSFSHYLYYSITIMGRWGLRGDRIAQSRDTEIDH